jgi:NADH-quinone oxidoreductase subunit A
MYFDYLNVLLFSLVGFLFVFINVAVGSLLRPKRDTDEGLETYECGELTTGDTWIKFDIRYYTVALVYVVFAVEIAFLFPWAIVLGDAFDNTGIAEGSGIGMFALVEGVIFIGILFLGLAYVWLKGDLDWVLAYDDSAFEPGVAGPHGPTPRPLHEIEAELEPTEVATSDDGSDDNDPKDDA